MINQDYSSQHIVSQCGVSTFSNEENTIMLDYCAGNGGKTFTIMLLIACLSHMMFMILGLNS